MELTYQLTGFQLLVVIYRVNQVQKEITAQLSKQGHWSPQSDRARIIWLTYLESRIKGLLKPRNSLRVRSLGLNLLATSSLAPNKCEDYE